MSQLSDISLELSQPGPIENHVPGPIEVENPLAEFAEPSVAREFQVRLKVIFITAPKNDSDPETVLKSLKTLFATYSVKFMLIVRELHLDGTPHLHAIIRCDKQPKVASTKIDRCFGKHVNVQKVKKLSAAVEYLFKSGTPIGYSGDGKTVEEIRAEFGNQSKKRKGVFDEVAKKIMAKDDKDLFDDYSGFMLQNLDKVRKFQHAIGNIDSQNFKMPTEIPIVDQLKRWQLYVVKLLLKQNDRHVLWVSDEVGASGKTWLSDYLENHYNAFVITGGKKVDILYAYQYQEIIVFNFPRLTEDRVQYDLIENFKDGRLFSSKYESTVKKRKGIKVVIFANFTPQVEKLSLDRWLHGKINNNRIKFYDHSDQELDTNMLLN